MTPVAPEHRRELFEIDELGEVLRVSPSMIWKLLRTNQLASVRIGRRRLVSAEAVRSYIERNTVPAA